MYAFAAVDARPVFLERNGLLRTDFHAGAAADAFARRFHDLRLIGLRLRIGAPFASERTAFEEHQGPQPMSVMNGTLLYIKDHRFSPFLLML